MKQSSIQYIVSFILFIVSLLWTMGMFYAYLYKGMTVFSIAFLMLSIIPVIGFTTATLIYLVGRQHAKWEKLYRDRLSWRV